MRYETMNEGFGLTVYDHNMSPQEMTVSSAWQAAQTVVGLSEKELKQHNALIAMELFRLRTAYPTQARNYTEQEVQATNALWSEIFAGVDPRLLHMAVMRFIITDKKAFFPAPGQIVACVEQIIKERQAEEERIRIQQERERWRRHKERIDSGENCDTCRFCDHRREEPRIDDPQYRAYQTAFLIDEREKLKVEHLYCTNPKSYKYEGKYGYGTVADLLCDEYEPQNSIAALLPPKLGEVETR